MKYIFLITFFLTFSNYLLAQNIEPELQKKIDQIIQNAKESGSVDQPVTDKAKNVLDSSTKSQLARKKPEGYYSSNCQDWKKIDLEKQQSEFKQTKMYYKTLEGGFPSLFDTTKQTMFSLDEQKIFFLKVISDAVVGIVNGVPVYRELDSKKINSGLGGILQGILLITAEGASSWHLTATENLSPRLLYMINDNTHPELKKYTSVICSKDAKCFLVNKNKKSEELRINSREHLALKSQMIFSHERLNVFFRMCESIEMPSFHADLVSDIKSFGLACQKKISPALADNTKMSISAICSELKYYVLPHAKSYR